jgi:hypothetical protein
MEPSFERTKPANAEETSEKRGTSTSQLAALQQQRLSLATILQRPNTARCKMEIIEHLLETYKLKLYE